jgi:cysteine/glycine-rich protein
MPASEGATMLTSGGILASPSAENARAAAAPAPSAAAVPRPRPSYTPSSSASFVPKPAPALPAASKSTGDAFGGMGSGATAKRLSKFVATANPKCQVCAKSVYFAEQVQAGGKVYHKACLKCRTCLAKLDSSTVCVHDGAVFCKGCRTKQRCQSSEAVDKADEIAKQAPSWLQASMKTMTKPSRQKTAPGRISKFAASNAPKCHACHKSVYAAEQVMAGGSPYHKQCMKCKVCTRSLDPTNLCDREGDLYCKNCYSKAYGRESVLVSTGI